MPNITRRQALLILIAVAAFAATAIGTYGLLIGPRRNPTQHTAGTDPAAAEEATPRPAEQPIKVADRTTDPVAYARWVATTLFNWDTTTGYLPTDYTAPLLADGDPTGDETTGLIGDVATYVPTVEQWLNLATMNVVQTISISNAVIPADWPNIATTSHGQLRLGTTAVTITGTRRRTGVWNGGRQAASTPVSFTVFVACRPTFARCHLLRLSELNQPLP